MPGSVMFIEVLERGERANAILARAGEELGREIRPDADGAIILRFDQSLDEAREWVSHAFRQADPDWQDYVHVRQSR